MATAATGARWWRWLGYGLGALALLALAFAAFVWVASEAHLRSFAPPPRFARPIATDAATLAHGQQLTRTRGCISCHGDALHGSVFEDDPLFGRAVAVNLVQYAHRQPPHVFERALRHGIGQDGRALWSMPSFNFVHLSDADVAALYAYLRSLPAGGAPLPAGWLGLPRLAVALGQDAAIPAFVAQMPPLSWQAHPDPAVRRGEYLAMTSCNECHGFGLRGDNQFAPPARRAPDLAIVASYDAADFARLMRTGKAAGNRELPRMSGVARGRYAHWTDAEIADLYAFLSAMGTKAAGG